MTTTLFVILIAIIILLAAAETFSVMELSTFRTMLKLKCRDYDELMGRAIKAETDFHYLKDTISAMLQRPVVATLRDDQLEAISMSLARVAMQAIQPMGQLKN